MVAAKSTPEQRRALKAQKRRDNQINHVRTAAEQAPNGRARIVVACNAALAAGKRITETARHDLARAIVHVVEQADIPENRKERT
jgi:hypothetical protein